jgi:N-acetyl-alpha-D-glucosaminyl L-malate synthase BshA
MRIGIVCYPSIGGSGLVATQLGLRLAELGHDVHFISYATPFKLQQYRPRVQFHAVDPIEYPLFHQTLYTFSLTAKIIEVVEQFDLDVVHAHYSIPHSLCAHLAREITGRDFRIVTTLHGTDVTIVGQDRPLFPINKYGIEKSDVVTTVSQFQRSYTKQRLGIAKEIEVIYNFIDPQVFKPREQPHRCLAPPEERLIMHIGNFRQPKNPAGVLQTFIRVARQVPNARLVLVGEGPELGSFRQSCREHHLCDRITYLGAIDNVEMVLPMADCVLQPSYHESFGMVLLEAMACGVPTVSSNVDGIPEVVAHGETGYTAGPDDHDALAAHVVAICRDACLQQRLGQAGRERAISHFHHDHIVPQYLAVYERLLAGRG